MSIVLGCIADDFTGATDLAGLLARAGASVRLRIGIPEGPVEESSDIEIIALKCRTQPVEDAVAECEAAAKWLINQGASDLYWKYCSTFDSTPQGNIGPVAESLMKLTGHKQALYCPAFPENGRSVYFGYLFVGNQLLSESGMKDHPLTPMRDSNLMRVLQPQVQEKVGNWTWSAINSGQPVPDAKHVIGDALSYADLEKMVASSFGTMLMTGGSALAMPIPKLLKDAGKIELQDAARNLKTATTRTLIVSGSCSQMTQAQVQNWKGLSLHLDPLTLEREGNSKVLEWWDAQNNDETCLVYATADSESVARAQAALGIQKAGELVEECLAQLVKYAVRSGVDRVVVAGGETSGAVTKALNCSELKIGVEICPGVPWTFAKIEDRTIALALKSGNFGKVSFFEDAINAIEI